MEIWYRSEFPYNSKFTLTSKIAWNKHRRYKEGWLYLRRQKFTTRAYFTFTSRGQSDFAISRGFYFRENKTLAIISEFTVADIFRTKNIGMLMVKYTELKFSKTEGIFLCLRGQILDLSNGILPHCSDWRERNGAEKEANRKVYWRTLWQCES